MASRDFEHVPQIFQSKQNNSTFVRINEHEEPMSNFQSNLSCNPQFYSIHAEDAYRKPRNVSESDSTGTTDFLLAHGQSSTYEHHLPSQSLDDSSLRGLIPYERLRYGCLCLRHVLLACAVILLTFSLGIFLYDFVNAKAEMDAPDFTTEKAQIAHKAALQPLLHRQEKAALQALPPRQEKAAFLTYLAPEESAYEDEASNLKEREVSSAKDLKALNQCQHLVIDDLVEDLPSASTLKENLDVKDQASVKKLEVKGAVTEEWLQFLLSSFSAVSELVLNVEGICIGSKVTDRLSLQPIKLESVRSLKIEKTQLCSLMNWVMRWEMPNIREIQIHDADLNKWQFEPLLKFMTLNRDSLSSVTISKSFICSDCKFPQELESRMKISIIDPLDPLGSDYYEDYEV